MHSLNKAFWSDSSVKKKTATKCGFGTSIRTPETTAVYQQAWPQQTQTAASTDTRWTSDCRSSVRASLWLTELDMTVSDIPFVWKNALATEATVSTQRPQRIMYQEGGTLRLTSHYIILRTPQKNVQNYKIIPISPPPSFFTPNVNYSGRTAPLTSKVPFHICIQQI